MPNALIAFVLALQAAPPAAIAPPAPGVAPAASSIEARMLALYDEVCLKTFPDDVALDALMARKGATALTREHIAVTLRDDPGSGWLLADGDRTVQVTLELPPYHACSVRRRAPAGLADSAAYRTLISGYKANRPGFEQIPWTDIPSADLLIRAGGEGRILLGGRQETLLIFEQRVRDAPQGDAGGLTDVRFVHQLVEPGAK